VVAVKVAAVRLAPDMVNVVGVVVVDDEATQTLPKARVELDAVSVGDDAAIVIR
jgi:hypothetical protein